MGNTSSSKDRTTGEDTVDLGFLTPQGAIYPSAPRDWAQPVVAQLIVQRKLAPFYRPLEDYEDDWDETKILAAMKRPPPLVPPDGDGSGGGSGSGGAGDASPSPSASSLSFQTQSSSTTPAHLQSATSPLRHAAGKSAIRGSGHGHHSSRDAQQQAQLQQQQQQMRELEAQVYRGAVDCPICFLYYPPNINHTRCCDQAICTECFVYIKRADPTTTHLVSEPACCPYCMQPNFGVTYSPPGWRAGIGADAATNLRPELLALGSSSSGSDIASSAAKRRRKSVSHTSQDVVTIDQIRPDWEEKLNAVRATVARRANRRIVMRQVGDQLIPVGITSGRVVALPPGAEGAVVIDEHSGGGASSGRRRRRDRGEGGGGGGILGHMGGPDLEELMIMEAMRLSMIEENERIRRQQEQERNSNNASGSGSTSAAPGPRSSSASASPSSSTPSFVSGEPAPASAQTGSVPAVSSPLRPSASSPPVAASSTSPSVQAGADATFLGLPSSLPGTTTSAVGAMLGTGSAMARAILGGAGEFGSGGTNVGRAATPGSVARSMVPETGFVPGSENAARREPMVSSSGNVTPSGGSGAATPTRTASAAAPEDLGRASVEIPAVSHSPSGSAIVSPIASPPVIMLGRDSALLGAPTANGPAATLPSPAGTLPLSPDFQPTIPARIITSASIDIPEPVLAPTPASTTASQPASASTVLTESPSPSPIDPPSAEAIPTASHSRPTTIPLPHPSLSALRQDSTLSLLTPASINSESGAEYDFLPEDDDDAEDSAPLVERHHHGYLDRGRSGSVSTDGDEYADADDGDDDADRRTVSDAGTEGGGDLVRNATRDSFE